VIKKLGKFTDVKCALAIPGAESSRSFLILFFLLFLPTVFISCLFLLSFFIALLSFSLLFFSQPTFSFCYLCATVETRITAQIVVHPPTNIRAHISSLSLSLSLSVHIHSTLDI